MATDNCPKKTISSDVTGLSYAREKCLGELPDVPLWNPLEPNSIDGFGATVTTATRTPIGSGRQRIKGEITDVEAAAGYTSDLTSHNHQDFMEGFLLADSRKLPVYRNDGETPQIVGIESATKTISFATPSTLVAGERLLIQDSGNENVDGVYTVDSVDGADVVVKEAIGSYTNAAPGYPKLNITQVGAISAAGALTVVASGQGYRLTTTGEFGQGMDSVIKGDWIYIHGLNTFSGFARVGAEPTANSVYLDRILGALVAGASDAAVAGQVFFSTSIRNPEVFEDMRFHSFQLEQTLGSDGDGTQARYIKGAMANEFTLTVPSADKVTAQFAFVAQDEETRMGSDGLKSGTRLPLVTYPMFNASNTSNRVWLHVEGEAEPLFTYATNATVTINNNMTGVKAIGVEGNLDINVGTFDVGGSITAYFLDLRGVRAMRSNADVGGTVALMGRNTGVLFDMPRMGLSNGATSIEQNTPVTIAIDMEAVRNEDGYTMQYAYFAYLPTPIKK